MPSERGKLIVVEGTDCSGKETQAKALHQALRGRRVPAHYITFPRYDTPTGRLVSMYLGKEGFKQEFGPSDNVPPKLASVLYAVIRYEAKPDMERLLDAGGILIANRYVESNMGHQGGKIMDAAERAKFMKWLEELEYGNFELPRPDRVIFLHMPFEVGMELKRGRPGEADGHESNPDHLRRAELAYVELAERYGWVRIACAPNRTRSSLRTIDDIQREVLAKTLEFLGNR